MATCKDCLHIGVCAYCVNDLPICDSFKDRSRFVELPCKVGDTVYEIDRYCGGEQCEECMDYCPPYPGDPDECMITGSRYRPVGCMTAAEKKVTLNDLLDCIKHDLWGKWLFPTREEAEKAIAERGKQ